MKLITIRCDVCSLELYHEEAGAAKSFHEPLTVSGFGYGERQSSLSGKHYCSVDCIATALSELVVGTPLEVDRFKAMAQKLGYEVSRPPMDLQANK